MSDLTAAAAALGIPEALAQRSAEARASETGASVEEILAVWAGGGSAPAPAKTPEATPETETVSDQDEGEPDQPKEETPEVTIEVPRVSDGEHPAPAVSGPTTRAPVSAEVTAAEASNLPVVVTVPTTGIKERTNFAMPKWLAALFLIVPLVALFALGGASTGECGSATELSTNVVTGEAVNCDGSPFEGSSIGGGSTDFIAMGEEIYQGQAVSGVNCAACHGASGGGGVGPAFNAVLAVFGSCGDQIDWVSLGTQGFQAEGISTYGDTNKPVGGVGIMPGFSATLTDEQVASVAAFERVRFGGGDPETTLSECGLVEEPAGEEGGEGATDGETPAPEEGGESAPPDGSETTVPGGDA